MPEATLPTKEEINQLPRWARVAFAARCARRALPLFTKNWPDAPREHVEAVTRAVEFAESAAHAHTDAAADAAVSAVAHAAHAAYVATVAARAAFAFASASASDAASDAANCATFAASDATYDATPFADTDATSDATYDATPFADTATAAAATAGISAPLIWADFQRALDESHRGMWTDSTPVPPSVFGPLEAIEEPATSPEPVAEPSASPNSKLEIDCYVGDLVDHVEVGSRITDLFRELNEYSLRKWGKGLTIDDFEQLVLAKVPAGVKR